eukprot:3123754-Amphidinium_carterae.1
MQATRLDHPKEASNNQCGQCAHARKNHRPTSPWEGQGLDSSTLTNAGTPRSVSAEWFFASICKILHMELDMFNRFDK